MPESSALEEAEDGGAEGAGVDQFKGADGLCSTLEGEIEQAGHRLRDSTFGQCGLADEFLWACRWLIRTGLRLGRSRLRAPWSPRVSGEAFDGAARPENDGGIAGACTDSDLRAGFPIGVFQLGRYEAGRLGQDRGLTAVNAQREVVGGDQRFFAALGVQGQFEDKVVGDDDGPRRDGDRAAEVIRRDREAVQTRLGSIVASVGAGREALRQGRECGQDNEQGSGAAGHVPTIARGDIWYIENERGPVAQLGARFHGMEEVEGSNPSRSTRDEAILRQGILTPPGQSP